MNERIKSRQDLRDILDRHRAEGRKIVLTNGCFDLLHVGHLHTFREARKLGDIFVVALNSDDSVRALKGADRPFVSEDQRAELIAELRSVDYVVIFNELDPLAIVTELQPDVLVKGEDWKEGTIIGQNVVEARGGKVVRIPLVKGVSTTALMNRLRLTPKCSSTPSIS
nr:adenylyltransferase/cytidyltransferase family protein [Deltaproteobacteria bacterium]